MKYPSGCSKRQLKMTSHFISAILIPILIAVFTIVLAFQQESIAKANREVDLRIATGQHQQNLELATEEHLNDLLITYMDNISDLLLANNLSLDKQILQSIVYPKTLFVLRQLDPKRKSDLIRFLNDSQLIATEKPVFLSLRYANLTRVQFGSSEESNSMRYISFVSTYLNNASFISGSFTHGDFTYSRMRGALCNSSFNYAIFLAADLTDADLTGSHVFKADFTRAVLRSTKISPSQLKSVGSISDATLPNGAKGRNLNLFKNSICENLLNGNNIQQNVNIRNMRDWASSIRRKLAFQFRFSGWFYELNDLRLNFTEYDEDNASLDQYSCTRKDIFLQNTVSESCNFTRQGDGHQATNGSDHYEYVDVKRLIQPRTHAIGININLGQRSACRDVYFSIETN
ncbi:unnamed protein product [Adineta ricciae]|uniref:Pentapeptide repeat-containing protein n=1 Tax=Adineta ricciae TaxID=249248 RepID=A0A814TTS9_ADIRI|nr:unnamed protein product [Adineta ricciae]CAF1281288.1 unnamed protein product [Adineta ricciae]